MVEAQFVPLGFGASLLREASPPLRRREEAAEGGRLVDRIEADQAGRTIVVDHGSDMTTLYGHLSGFTVTEGQKVHRGDTLGYVGLSGRSTGSHLHYEVRVRNTPVNPNKFLRTTFAQQFGSATGAM